MRHQVITKFSRHRTIKHYKMISSKILRQSKKCNVIVNTVVSYFDLRRMCERVSFGKTAAQMDFLDRCPMEMGPTAAENRCLTRSFGSQALVLPHSLWAIESRNVLIRIPQHGSAAGNWQLV